MPDEEEMEAMFNMMFAEMMGFGGGFGRGSGGRGRRGGGGGMFGIPTEMFDMMEAMMMDEDMPYDDEDEDDNEDDDDHQYASLEEVMGAFGLMAEDDDEFDSDDYDEDDIAAAFGFRQADVGSLLLGELLAAEQRHGSNKLKPGSSKAGSSNTVRFNSIVQS